MHGIFLSCVSKEFHGDTSPGAVPWPDSYREQLARYLEECGQHVVYQETFAQGGGDLLAKLEGYIREECKAVIHLIGREAGWSPDDDLPPSSVGPCDAVQALLARHKDRDDLFLAGRPNLRQQLVERRFQGISATQWEAYIAIHYNKPLFVFAFNENAVRAPTMGSQMSPRTDRLTQIEHFNLLKQTCHSRNEGILNQHDLIRTVSANLIREKIFSRGESSSQNVDGLMEPSKLPHQTKSQFHALLDLLVSSKRRHQHMGQILDYFPRRWIEKDIEDWFYDNETERRIYWLEGEAGFGKSSLARYFAEKDYTAASIFCSAGTATGPQGKLEFVSELLGQALTKVTELRDWVERLDLQILERKLGDQWNPEKVAEVLLLDVLFAGLRSVREGRLETENEKWLFVIDGIDEAVDREDGSYSNAISNLVKDVIGFDAINNTSSTRFLVTARRNRRDDPSSSDDLLSELRSKLRVRVIENIGTNIVEQQFEDAKGFVAYRLRTICDRLRLTGKQESEVRNLVLQRAGIADETYPEFPGPDFMNGSDASFIFLHCLCSDLNAFPDFGSLKSAIQKMPKTMVEWYDMKLGEGPLNVEKDSLEQQFLCLAIATQAERLAYSTLVEILSHVRHPTESGRELKASRNKIDQQLKKFLATLSGVIDIKNDSQPVVFFHASIVEWLIGFSKKPRFSSFLGRELIGQWAIQEVQKAERANQLIIEAEIPLVMTKDRPRYWYQNAIRHLLDAFVERILEIQSAKGFQDEQYQDAAATLTKALVLLTKFQNHSSRYISTRKIPCKFTSQIIHDAIPRLSYCLGVCLDERNLRENAGWYSEVNAMDLLEVFGSCYLTDTLSLVARWIARTQHERTCEESGIDEWNQLLVAKLVENDYVLRVSLADGQREYFESILESEVAVDSACHWLEQLLSDTHDVARLEMDCYTVVAIALAVFAGEIEFSNRNDLQRIEDILMKLVERIAAIEDLYFTRSCLADLMLQLSTSGAHGIRFLERLERKGFFSKVWTCVWEHTKLDTEYLQATKLFDRGRERPDWLKEQERWAKSRVGPEKNLENLDLEAKLLHSLHRCFRIVGIPVSQQTNEGTTDANEDREISPREFLLLEEWCDRNWETEKPLGRGKVAELFSILFLNANWAICEEVASTLFRLATRGQKWRTRVCDLVFEMITDRGDHQNDAESCLEKTPMCTRPKDWRIDYGLAEAAFQLRHLEDERFQFIDSASQERQAVSETRSYTLFDYTLFHFLEYPVSRVRANCVENFVADIFDRPGPWNSCRLNPRDHARLTDNVTGLMINSWLRDSDCWVLEHVYRLCNIFDKFRSKERAIDEWLLNVDRYIETLGSTTLLGALSNGAPGSGSRLVNNERWYRLPRSSFLKDIDRIKSFYHFRQLPSDAGIRFVAKPRKWTHMQIADGWL